jgi:hypothetical protein
MLRLRKQRSGKWRKYKFSAGSAGGRVVSLNGPVSFNRLALRRAGVARRYRYYRYRYYRYRCPSNNDGPPSSDLPLRTRPRTGRGVHSQSQLTSQHGRTKLADSW